MTSETQRVCLICGVRTPKNGRTPPRCKNCGECKQIKC